MYDIVIGPVESRRGISFADFSGNFEKICTHHRKSGRALAFAALVYEYSNPEFAEVVQNPKYWDALDDISGKYLTVFAINVGTPGGPRERKQVKAAKTFFEEQLTVDGSSLQAPLPALYFFQVDAGKVIDALAVKLDSEDSSDAFKEVRSLLICARDAVTKVQKENRGNSKEIFDLIEGEIGQKVLLKRLGKAVNIIAWIKGLTG